jgi:tetratricopeptide (TPR) repeat protein
LYDDAGSEVRELHEECEKLDLTSKLYDDTRARLYILEESHAPNESELLLTLKQLGSVLVDQWRFKEALVYLERAYRGLLEKFGPTDERTMDCFWLLSNTYLNLRSYPQEMKLCQNILTTLDARLGPDNIVTLRVVYEISRCLGYQGRSTEAVKGMQRVVAGFEKAKGSADETTRRYSNELSVLLHRTCLVRCDYCFKGIADHSFFYHCDICNVGDFNLCEDCVTNGVSCGNAATHIMIKQSTEERKEWEKCHEPSQCIFDESSVL